MRDARALHLQQFDTAAEVIVNSPGRINLIGEHTDYCGLPVLPMAIGNAIQIAASERPQPGLTAVSSLDGELMESEAGPSRSGWARYVLAVLDEINPFASSRGAQIALDSDLPSTGGLSSSSALSVGCLIALNELWQLDLEPARLVEMALRAEKSAAIAGGAMDQTVIMYARPGHALRIDFDPPSHRHIQMPDGFAWIAAYSGTPAPKGESAAASYNSFVLASRAAAVLLGSPVDPTGVDPPQLSRVSDANPDQLAGLPTITVAEAADLTAGGNLELPSGRKLDLRVSAEHVLSEAGRVEAAEIALGASELAELGHLMDASHASLRRYGASTPSLERLVTSARSAGAAGARLTGAGFGGWAVALTTPERAGDVQAAMLAGCGGPTLVVTPEGGALWSLTAQ